jgi:uncharacterized protein (TIGR03435 family)
MRNWILAIVAGVALTGTAQAQSLAGQWQGVLQAGRDLRTVIRVAPGDGPTFSAVFYSIDQGGQGLTATVTVRGSDVSMSIPALNGSFEGKLSADRNTLTGTWSQGAGKLPLTLTRASGDAAWTIPERPAALKPMPADASPKVETATVKPSEPGRPGKAFTVRGRNLVTINTTVSDLVTMAYQVHARQVIGAPAWVESEKYDLTVQPDIEGLPAEKQLRSLIQQVLADRFKLTFHHDKRELPAYALVVAKDGPKLTKSSGDPNGLPGLFFRGLGVLPAANASMDNFADVMQSAVLDRPVVNRTGVQGRYDFTLTWTPDESQFAGLGVRVPPPSGDPNAPPVLFTAIQEQLGLRLDSVKAPVDVLVIDNVEKPSEN